MTHSHTDGEYVAEEIAELKRQRGKDISISGSGSLVRGEARIFVGYSGSVAPVSIPYLFGPDSSAIHPPMLSYEHVV